MTLASYTHELVKRPTPSTGPPPKSLANRPLLGPEYLFSDVERAMAVQLKLGKVDPIPLLIKTFTS